MIPYGKQDINQADIDSVIDILQSDFLTQGPQVPLFEKKVSDYCGSEFGKGDWLWTSPNTFVASSNCALHCGAQIDFVDIDPRTFNMSVERLAEKLAQAKKDGKLPKIVVPVHMCGQSCDMAGINELSQKYGFKIIEDP